MNRQFESTGSFYLRDESLLIDHAVEAGYDGDRTAERVLEWLIKDYWAADSFNGEDAKISEVRCVKGVLNDMPVINVLSRAVVHNPETFRSTSMEIIEQLWSDTTENMLNSTELPDIVNECLFGSNESPAYLDIGLEFIRSGGIEVSATTSNNLFDRRPGMDTILATIKIMTKGQDIDVVGLAGPKRVGCSTAKNIIEKLGFSVLSFADPIKRITQTMFNLTDDEAFNDDKKDLVIERVGYSPRELWMKVGADLVRDHCRRSVLGAQCR